jgi:restriction system protein
MTKNNKPLLYVRAVPEDYVVKMTPIEFEIMVKDYIEDLGKDLQDFKVIHNSHLAAHDGTYQIDVLASYTALNVEMVVIVECKRHSSAIKRETVQLLHDKLNSTGAQKGILFSTSGFQDGAISYALKHKIALVRMLPGSFQNITNSAIKRELSALSDTPKFMAECRYGRMLYYIKLGKLDGLRDYLLDGM